MERPQPTSARSATRPISIGTAGRLQSEWVADINRNARPTSSESAGEGNELDNFIGSAAEFRVPGEWQSVGQELLRYRKRGAGTLTSPRTRRGRLISKASPRGTGPDCSGWNASAGANGTGF